MLRGGRDACRNVKLLCLSLPPHRYKREMQEICIAVLTEVVNFVTILYLLAHLTNIKHS